jgi:hypothetical protein
LQATRDHLEQLSARDSDNAWARCELARVELALADLHATFAAGSDPEASVARRAAAVACRRHAHDLLVALRTRGCLPPSCATLLVAASR